MSKSNLITSTDAMLSDKKFLNALTRINLRSKIIIFIEPSGLALTLIKCGIRNRYNIIILTANSQAHVALADLIRQVRFAIQLDTLNEHDVLSVVQRIQDEIPIHAVIPGFEYFVPMAARISKCLDLQSIDVKDVMQLRNKALMRMSLERAGIKIPVYEIVTSCDELNQAINRIGFPAVCKPAEAAGDVYVKKVSNTEEAYHAASVILEENTIPVWHELSRAMIYEKYFEGKDYSVEGIVIQGKIKYCSLTEKSVANEHELIETGRIVNSLIELNLKKRIEKYIEEVISVLHPNNCPFHAEIRISKEDQPLLMELCACLPSDKIGDLITLSREINFYDSVYYAYLGNKLALCLKSCLRNEA